MYDNERQVTAISDNDPLEEKENQLHVIANLL